MAAGGDDFDGIALGIQRLPRQAQAGCWFESHLAGDILTGTDSAQNSAGMVTQKALGRDQIAMQGARLRDGGETGADFNAFDGID